jgi:hypothetical protein
VQPESRCLRGFFCGLRFICGDLAPATCVRICLRILGASRTTTKARLSLGPGRANRAEPARSACRTACLAPGLDGNRRFGTWLCRPPRAVPQCGTSTVNRRPSSVEFEQRVELAVFGQTARSDEHRRCARRTSGPEPPPGRPAGCLHCRRRGLRPCRAGRRRTPGRVSSSNLGFRDARLRVVAASNVAVPPGPPRRMRCSARPHCWLLPLKAVPIAAPTRLSQPCLLSHLIALRQPSFTISSPSLVQ